MIHDHVGNNKDQQIGTNKQTGGHQVDAPCSNWLPPFDDQEFATAQQNDNVIKRVIDLKASNDNKPEIKSPITECNTLFQQWELL